MDLSWKSIQKQNDVSLMLAKHVFGKSSDANMVFSPLSIQIALGLVAAGAKGPTLDKLLSFFDLDSIDELNSLSSRLVTDVLVDGSSMGGPRLSAANGVWVEKSCCLKPTYQQVVCNVYKAACRSVDFRNKANEVANEVYQWAQEETNGLIEDILPPGSVDKSTRLILANALFFKGAWKAKFIERFTKDHEFHLLNGNSVEAPFMTDMKNQFVAAYDGFKVLRLPYKYGTDKRYFCMYFFLPDAVDGLPTLMDKATSEPGFLDRHEPSKAVRVGEFLIPKFKITFEFEASEVLKGLGLTLPFLGDGLTEMFEDEPMFVDKVLHKSFIEVNEEGTEAAAVTVIPTSMFSSCFPGMIIQEEKIDFVADHPFLFVVRDDGTGVVLFTGTVLNPLV